MTEIKTIAGVSGSRLTVFCPAGKRMRVLLATGVYAAATPFEAIIFEMQYKGILVAQPCTNPVSMNGLTLAGDVTFGIGLSHTFVYWEIIGDAVAPTEWNPTPINYTAPLPDIWWDDSLSVVMAGSDSAAVDTFTVTYELE